MSEIDLDGQRFQCGKMATRTQWHVAIRLLPGIGNFWPILGGDVGAQEGFFALVRTMPLINPADADFVIDACLDCVRFFSHGNWAPLRAPGSSGDGGLMCQQADHFDTQLRLVWEVLYENMRNFSIEKVRPSSAEAMVMGMPSAA